MHALRGAPPGPGRGGGAPTYQTSTFVYPDAEAFERRDLPQTPYYDYTRRSNPTTTILEAKLARLERGSWARGFASGMGAIIAAIGACISAGAHVVALSHCYLPTRRYLTQYLDRFDVQTTFVPGRNPEDFVAAIRDQTRVIYLESPTSGFFEVIELAPIVEAARARGIITVFDNSWASPYFQQPLELGCDLVVHSATKYLGGHSDALGGIIVGRNEELRQKIAFEGELLGATPDPFASWLILRGLRTLAVRMEQHQRSGLALARVLAEHPQVQRVYHPGLQSGPSQAVAERQLSGYASLFSFTLREQTREATHRFLNRLRLFSIGCSWGGHESLAVGGLLFGDSQSQSPWLIRLHVGLEATEDLIRDVQQALED